MRAIALTAAIVALPCSAHAAEERPAPKPGDAEVPAAIGKFWRAMFQWPSVESIREKSIPHSEFYSKYWLRKVIAPSWLPPEDVKPIFMKAEVDGRDVARLRWAKHGYDIQVSQTLSIFAIKLTPQDARGTGKDDREKLRCARELCLRLFYPTGTHWDGQGRPISIEKLPDKIAWYSFTENTLERRKGDKGLLLGRPRTMAEEGVTRPLGLRDNNPYDPNWCQTPFAWLFWFRNVHWWNDGYSVGIYFFKEQGGPTDIRDGRLDRRWFETGGRTM